MLDELLGRAELKERIAELEAEVESLEARYEAESERRSEAVSARQAAEERVNRLEDRIADLEGRLAAAEEAAAEEEAASFRGRETLAGDRLRAVLSRLRSVAAGPEGALTAFVADDPPAPVVDALGDRAPLVRRAAPCLVCVDDAGLVAAALSVPCPPEPFAAWSDGFVVEDPWFRPQPGDALALVRSDLFVVGRYAGDGPGEGGATGPDGGDAGSTGGGWRVVETVESDVKSAHSKGGFSQGRFERRRDAQVDDHVDRALAALDGVSADRLLVAGERTVLGAFEERADVVARVDATGDPEAAFDAAVDDVFAATLSLL